MKKKIIIAGILVISLLPVGQFLIFPNIRGDAEVACVDKFKMIYTYNNDFTLVNDFLKGKEIKSINWWVDLSSNGGTRVYIWYCDYEQEPEPVSSSGGRTPRK